MTWPQHTRIATATQAQEGDFDALELRLDVAMPNLTEDALVELIEAMPKRGVATYRPKRQGGNYEGDENARINALRAVQETTGCAIDVEADIQDGAKLGHLFAAKGPLIRSLHLPMAPERDAGLNLLTKCQDEHGELQKLAFPCSSFLDQLRALELCWQHSHHGHPVIVPRGLPALRALLPLVGNRATYGAAKEPLNGQPTMQELNDIWRRWDLNPNEVTPRTYWLATLGHPVLHSRSPAMHNAHLRAKGRPERMGALDVPDSPGALRLVASVAARIGLGGASVTSPHKQLLIEVCEPDEAAAAIGAANCVDFTRDRCTNTDATAMQRLLPSKAVTILGGGGFAKATAWAARQLGQSVTMCARKHTIPEANFVPWDERHELAGETLVQATTQGSGVGVDPNNFSHFIEAVYHEKSELLSAALALEMPLTTPEQLLLQQGLDAYRFWFNDEPDEAAMQEAMP